MIAPALQLFFAAWLVFLATGALVSGAVVRVVGKRVLEWEPRSRHRALLWLAALPLLLATVAMASATLPSWLALELPGFDHCASHETHPHLCFIHLPHSRMNTAALSLLLLVLAAALLKFGTATWRLWRARRLLNQLEQTGSWRTDVGAFVLESELPFCFAGGLLRPRIVISRGLLAALSADEQRVVVAHEEAHIRRRDALFGNLANLLLSSHLPSVARFLQTELELATEQACDEAAGDSVGDRVTVAETILAVHRAASCNLIPRLAVVTVSFGRCSSERRVTALLADRTPERSTSLLLGMLAAVGLGLLIVSMQLHHLIEALLFSIAY